jgi:hypothetical protein
MFKIVDLVCDACRTVEEELLEPDEAPSSCPSCGGARRKTSIHPGARFHDLSFKPFDLAPGSKVHFDTKAEWDAYVKRQEIRTGAPIQVEGFDRRLQRERADEVRHEAWEFARTAGRDLFQEGEVCRRERERMRERRGARGAA